MFIMWVGIQCQRSKVEVIVRWNACIQHNDAHRLTAVRQLCVMPIDGVVSRLTCEIYLHNFHIQLLYMLSLSSDRQHLSYDGCLEVRGKIIITVLCCIVYWSCAVISALSSYSSMDWVLSHWTHFTVHRFICVYLCFCFILLSYCIIVSMVGWTWWDWSLILRIYLPSVLWHCWFGHVTRKTRS